MKFMFAQAHDTNGEIVSKRNLGYIFKARDYAVGSSNNPHDRIPVQ